MSDIEVALLGVNDWRRLRELRLAAFADSPEAFASTLEREEAFSRDEWVRHTGSNAAALLDGQPVGLVGWFPNDDEPGTIELVSMWVDPAARGRGAGKALVEFVLSQAAHMPDVWRVSLWVVTTNLSATALYASLGFTATGETMRLPSRPELTEQRMAAAVATT